MALGETEVVDPLANADVFRPQVAMSFHDMRSMHASFQPVRADSQH